MSTTRARLDGQTLLITGADGFIGSHLVEHALDAGATVRAFCLYNSFGSAGWLDESEPFRSAVADGRAELVLGDVRDPAVVDAAVEGVDAVLHLGALIAIPYSYQVRLHVGDQRDRDAQRPRRLRRHERRPDGPHLDVRGLRHRPDVADHRVAPAAGPVAVQRDQDRRRRAGRERSPGPSDAGGRSSARSTRSAPGSRPARSSPPCSPRCSPAPTQIRVGSTAPKRDFTFVTDTCDGFVKAVSADLEPGATVQLGTGTRYSIGEIVEMCRQITGSTAEIVTEDDRMRPPDSEVEILLSDPSSALTRLGWEPTIDLGEGLRRRPRPGWRHGSRPAPRRATTDEGAAMHPAGGAEHRRARAQVRPGGHRLRFRVLGRPVRHRVRGRFADLRRRPARRRLRVGHRRHPPRDARPRGAAG